LGGKQKIRKKQDIFPHKTTFFIKEQMRFGIRKLVMGWSFLMNIVCFKNLLFLHLNVSLYSIYTKFKYILFCREYLLPGIHYVHIVPILRVYSVLFIHIKQKSEKIIIRKFKSFY